MRQRTYAILLADDDYDDCVFFEESLEELHLSYTLKTVNDGVKLMQFLRNKTVDLPDILFLDLNMPRKNGYECLDEIKRDELLKTIPVVIISTSYDHEVVEELYRKGANYYIRKPGEYAHLKKTIHTAISQVAESTIQPAKDDFVINKL